MSKVENGIVSVPRDYFLKTAKADYNNYKDALAREFYQNSVDAGASLIEVNFNSGARSITVKDDGCGMDYYTIKNKLLVLGGSKKRDGDVGAFGVAKEVLYFSWERYEIRTQNLIVTGKGAEYTIRKVDDWYDGCTSTIWLWDTEEFHTFSWSFRSVASKFQVNATIKVEDNRVPCDLRRGTFIRDLGWAELFVDESKKDNWYTKVRIAGQWMFSNWHGEDDIGEVVLELKKSSVECLTSNRDALKAEYKDQFSNFLKEMLLDKKTALEAINPTYRKKYKGTGKVSVGSLKKFAESIGRQIQKVLGIDPKDILTVEEKDKDNLIDSLLDIIPAENMNPSRMERLIAEVEKRDFSFDLERLVFIGYEPDFVTVYEKKDRSRVEKFMKSRKATVLAKAWTEVVKQILLDIEWYGQFTAGFRFEDGKAAGYEKIEGEHYFYLNPDLLLSEVDEEIVEKYKYNAKAVRPFVREDLIAKAIHEIAHLEVSYHNDRYTSQNEWTRARTWKSLDIYPVLVDEAFAK